MYGTMLPAPPVNPSPEQAMAGFLGTMLLTVAFFAYCTIAASAFLFTDSIKHVFSPLTLTVLRLLVGTLTQWTLLLVYGCFQLRLMIDTITPLFNVRIWWKLALVGLFNCSIPYTLYPVALDSGMNIAALAALVSMSPFFVQLYLLIERKSRRQHSVSSVLFMCAGGVVAVAGIFLMKLDVFLHNSLFSSTIFYALMGCILGLFCAASKAAASSLVQLHLESLNFASIVLGQSIAALIISTVVLTLYWIGWIAVHFIFYSYSDSYAMEVTSLTETLLRDVEQIALPPLHEIVPLFVAIVYLGCFASCLAYILQFFLVKNIGALREVLSDFVVPLLALVESLVFQHLPVGGKNKNARGDNRWNLFDLESMVLGLLCVAGGTACCLWAARGSVVGGDAKNEEEEESVLGIVGSYSTHDAFEERNKN
jgi:drug/metabolite transporter (DMT)-like permease